MQYSSDSGENPRKLWDRMDANHLDLPTYSAKSEKQVQPAIDTRAECTPNELASQRGRNAKRTDRLQACAQPRAPMEGGTRESSARTREKASKGKSSFFSTATRATCVLNLREERSG